MGVPDFLNDGIGGVPSDTAYIFVDVRGRETARLTRGALEACTHRIASALRASGARRTAIVLPPGPDLLKTFVGALRAQAVPVLCEPRGRKLNSGTRLDNILEDCRPTHIIAAPDQLEALSGRGAAVLTPAELENSLGVSEARLPPCASDVPAYLQYTSGSTGSAKGTLVTFGNLADNLNAISTRLNLSAKSVAVIWLPPYHDMGLVGGLMVPLHARFPVVLLRTEDFVRRPLTWLELVSRYRGTISGGPMFGWTQALARCAVVDTEELDLSSWQTAFVGAEPIHAATLCEFTGRFTGNGFVASAFLPCYGLAEATLFVSAAGPCGGLVERSRPGGSVGLDVDCGKPWQSFTVRIVDPATRQRVSDGTVGEIWLAGPSVAHDLNTRKSLASCMLAGDPNRYLATGDLGYLSDGSLSITGRIKSMIKVHGRKILAEDVEAVVRQHVPHIVGVAAFSPSHAGIGSDQLELVAEVGRNAEKIGLSEAIGSVVGRAMGVVPAHVWLVARGTIPRTVSGKIDRGSLANLFNDGVCNG